MKRFVAVVTAATAVVGGLAVTPFAQAVPPREPAAEQHDYTPPPVNWGECDIPRLVKAGAECGFVVVPLDYDNPSGEKIKLAVSRVEHTSSDADYQGPMLVNPGGPGGSGLIYSIFGDFVPNGGGDTYDWVGFDPRGVGSSEPSLSCIPDYDGYNRPYYVPVTRRLERTWLRKSRDYARACERNGGDLLDHITTIDAAKDMESIRKALGAPRINYYGFSYGTYLGQVYGTLYPDNFRRVIFDGVVNPTRVWYDANLDQDIAFDENIKVYFEWVAKYDDVYHLGDTADEVEDLFYAEQRKLRRDPAGGIIGPDEWTDIFLSAGYYVYGWEDIAQAFAGFVHDGKWKPLRDLYGTPPFHDNGHAVYLAVECTDAQWPKDYRRWRIDNWLTHFRAPFTTWGNAWFNGPCLYWPAEAGTPVEIDGSGVDSALLISETHDAATPYAGALEVRERFPGSVLIEGVGGTTHSGSLSGVACTDSRIVAYLKTGELPARKPGNRSDVQCDPVPQPVPDDAAVTRRTTSSDVRTLREQLAAPIPR